MVWRSTRIHRRVAGGGSPDASNRRGGGRLVLAGGPDGWPLDAPGAVTRLSHDRAIGRCSAATITPGGVRQQIVNYDPRTLTEHVLTTIARADAEYQQPPAVIDRGALYFLDVRMTSGSTATPTRLYRLHQR